MSEYEELQWGRQGGESLPQQEHNSGVCSGTVTPSRQDVLELTQIWMELYLLFSDKKKTQTKFYLLVNPSSQSTPLSQASSSLCCEKIIKARRTFRNWTSSTNLNWSQLILIDLKKVNLFRLLLSPLTISRIVIIGQNFFSITRNKTFVPDINLYLCTL